MNPSHPPADRIPVIVGTGEITDRPSEITDGLEPLVLLVEALKRAEADSGVKWLGEIDSLDVVNFLSWRYREPEKLLSSRLGIRPKHLYYGPVGGESPIRYLHEAAQRIARGECSVAAVCGAEAQSTRQGPSGPASRCPGSRSLAMSRSQSAVRHFKSRLPSSLACSTP